MRRQQSQSKYVQVTRQRCVSRRGRGRFNGNPHEVALDLPLGSCADRRGELPGSLLDVIFYSQPLDGKVISEP